jgi:hypothetical protein
LPTARDDVVDEQNALSVQRDRREAAVDSRDTRLRLVMAVPLIVADLAQ